MSDLDGGHRLGRASSDNTSGGSVVKQGNVRQQFLNRLPVTVVHNGTVIPIRAQITAELKVFYIFSLLLHLLATASTRGK